MEIHTKCPVCGGDAISIFTTYHIPKFGEALLTSISCEQCKYKSSDVLILKEDNPKRFKVKIDSPEKLNYRVIRSSYGNIKIPELGIEILATGFSEGFITNVDGLILRIEDVLRDKIMTEENKEKVENLLKKLEAARTGRITFTLILEDKTGNSAIIPNER